MSLEIEPERPPKAPWPEELDGQRASRSGNRLTIKWRHHGYFRENA